MKQSDEPITAIELADCHRENINMIALFHRQQI